MNCHYASNRIQENSQYSCIVLHLAHENMLNRLVEQDWHCLKKKEGSWHAFCGFSYFYLVHGDNNGKETVLGRKVNDYLNLNYVKT